MLPKNRRIPQKLFKQIAFQGKHFNSANFSIRFAPDNLARFAVSVSKKISKKAIIRNRTRRRIYSAIRSFLSEIKPGFYLIIAKPGSQIVKGEKLKKELQSLIANRRL